MEMGCFVNIVASWDKPLWASGDVSDQAALQAELQESIEVAERVNGRVVTTLIGRRDGIPASFQRATLVENLQRVAHLADRAGVVIGIEAVHNRDYPIARKRDVWGKSGAEL